MRSDSVKNMSAKQKSDIFFTLFSILMDLIKSLPEKAYVLILFSTVTTNFLAAHSAGVSGEVIGESFSKHINGKYLSVLVVLIGTIAAILYPMDNIEDFLYLINSVFAPMIAVMIADFFFNKKRSVTKEWDWTNLIVWLIGLSLYRVLMHVDIIIGYTLPDIVITAVLCVIVHRILPKNRLDKAL